MTLGTMHIGKIASSWKHLQIDTRCCVQDTIHLSSSRKLDIGPSTELRIRKFHEHEPLVPSTSNLASLRLAQRCENDHDLALAVMARSAIDYIGN